jgi:APA family basic amino acid/polyamine antiporter
MLLSALLRTKPLDHILADGEQPEHRLKKALTVWDLIALGIGAIIGTGIFVLIGTAVVGDVGRPGAGPGVMLSFVLAAVACVLTALCYAELAAMIPAAGSAYTYTYMALGEVFAWLTGWNLTLTYGVACVAVAIGWSGYFTNILRALGLGLPDWAIHPPGVDGGIINLPAALIVLLVTAALVVSTKESARTTGLIVLVKVSVIVFFVALGISKVDPTNWSPFLPNGLAGVGAAAAIVFFAFIGFDAVSTTAEEAHNPQRDLPIGIIGSLGICTLLYVAVAAVLTGIVPYQQIDVHAPVAEALRIAGFPWGALVVAIGAVAGITSVLFVMMMGQIRIFFAMSRDRLIGAWLSRVHPRFGTPHHATLLTGGAVAMLAAFVPIGEAANMTNIGTLFAFILVCTSVLVLRRAKPDHPRPFRVPFMPWIPLAGIVACGILMSFLPARTWIRFGVWTAVGIAIYLLYGIGHSRLATQEVRLKQPDARTASPSLPSGP